MTAAGMLAPAAEAAGFRAMIGGWRHDLAGFVIDRGQTYDFEQDLGLQSSGRRSIALELDTGAGWPDFAASYTQLGAHGARSESTTGGIGSLPLPGTTRTIVSDADFNDYDITARVPLDWSGGRLSLGLALKRLRGDVFIDDSDEPAPRRQRYDEVFPQVHARLRLPLTDFLGINAVAQGISYDGSRAVEYGGTVELRLLKRLLLEAGWQERRYEITVDDYRLDAALDGALLRFGFLLH